MHSFYRKLVVTAGCVVALAFFVPALIQGGESDLRTVFSINQQFTVPGKVLDANSDYVMMVGDAHTGMRRVVRIYNSDESELLTQFLAINEERREPAEKTTFTFIEMDEGQPQVIRSWFYPGRTIGLEFVYPEAQALEIARHSRETVLASDVNLAALDEEKGFDVDPDLSDLQSVEIVAIDPDDASREVSTTAAVTEDSSIAPLVQPEQAAVVEQESQTTVTLNEPVQPPLTDSGNVQIAQNQESEDLKADSEVVREKPSEPSSEVQSADSESDSLPATSGVLPLLGLVGGLSLGLGLGVRLFTIR
jgi:hypothetical protein